MRRNPKMTKTMVEDWRFSHCKDKLVIFLYWFSGWFRDARSDSKSGLCDEIQIARTCEPVMG